MFTWHLPSWMMIFCWILLLDFVVEFCGPGKLSFVSFIVAVHKERRKLKKKFIINIEFDHCLELYWSYDIGRSIFLLGLFRKFIARLF
jgi:hypothetical protein